MSSYGFATMVKNTLIPSHNLKAGRCFVKPLFEIAKIDYRECYVRI